MPELPEVETVVRGLHKNIIGKKITDIQQSNKRLRIEYPANLHQVLINQKISEVIRRSKYILIKFIDNPHILVIHLGMSGKILFSTLEDYEAKKHDHFILYLDNNDLMIFNDARRFGLVTLVEEGNIEDHKLFKSLGPEPFSDGFNEKYLSQKLEGKTISIKQAIMDANIVVGVGNIYASESLFRTGINPKKPAGKVSSKRLAELIKNIRIVLQEAINSGGSTLRDYVRSDGEIGYFQHNFKVYNKANQPCVICGSNIKKIVQQGRSTYYCGKCQKN
jgi:formamidopyrimidine-DNA glycosylase